MAFRSLTFLGTSSGTPTMFRNVSSAALKLMDGRVWLFDCGEGTQHQLLRSEEISLGKIEKIFLTHLHGDHCYGLPGLMCSISLLWRPLNDEGKKEGSSSTKDDHDDAEDHEEPETPRGIASYAQFSKTSKFLEIYGPPNTSAYIRSALRFSEAQFGFKYRVTEFVTPRRPTAVGSTQELKGAASSPPPVPVPGAFTPPRCSPCGACVNDLLPCEEPPLFIEAAQQAIPPLPIAALGIRPPPLRQQQQESLQSTTTPTAWVYTVCTDASTGVEILSAPLDHRVFSVGYVLREAPIPGKLDLNKAMALGVPKGPLLSKLKAGEAVTFSRKLKNASPTSSSGEASSSTADQDVLVTVRSQDVVDPPVPGRKLAFLGDTCCSTQLLPLAGGAEWIVQESTFDDDHEHLAVPRGHSTARMAGAFADLLDAKQLVLTHFSARYPPAAKSPAANDALKAQAEEAFVHKPASCSGPKLHRKVTMAEDFFTLDLGWKRKD